MKLIICLEDKNGYSFAGRRLSMDRVQRARMLEMIGEDKLFMNSYSAKQFEDGAVTVDEQFLLSAGENDYCFVENVRFNLDNCNKIVIYKWNRRYPADKFFKCDLEKEGFKLISSYEFAGSSHDNITEEVYEK